MTTNVVLMVIPCADSWKTIIQPLFLLKSKAPCCGACLFGLFVLFYTVIDLLWLSRSYKNIRSFFTKHCVTWHQFMCSVVSFATVVFLWWASVDICLGMQPRTLEMMGIR